MILINAVGVETPERELNCISKLKGVEKVDVSGKLNILVPYQIFSCFFGCMPNQKPYIANVIYLYCSPKFQTFNKQNLYQIIRI